ncbi:hypothetical protein ERJ75_000792900 [Trypanosoma vivax]|nr:hypothetical protein ERJ75_000792900 [Trypanosoma vivax]
MESNICAEEANKWRLCVEQHIRASNVASRCADAVAQFDSCIVAWRTQVGPDARVSGENEGEPPPQCAALSCLIGHCLRENGYNFERCKLSVQYFKHCVKSYYGSDYVA